jgi:hypothetical protein
MKFRSTFSPALFVFLAVVFGTVAVMMIRNAHWFGLSVIALQIAFFFVLFKTTSYVVNPEELIVKYGFFYKQRIPWSSVRRVKYTSNPMSSPAFSFKRIQIDHGKMSSVMISPNTREQFIEAIRPYVSEGVLQL